MYVPHFYFAVHYHAFVFLDLALFEAISPIHLRATAIAKLQRVYGGRRWLTAAKTAAISSIYVGLVLVTMGLIALVTLRRLG